MPGYVQANHFVSRRDAKYLFLKVALCSLLVLCLHMHLKWKLQIIKNILECEFELGVLRQS